MRLLKQITLFWWFPALYGPRMQLWCFRVISECSECKCPSFKTFWRPDPENSDFVQTTSGSFCLDWIWPNLKFSKFVQAAGSHYFFAQICPDWWIWPRLQLKTLLKASQRVESIMASTKSSTRHCRSVIKSHPSILCFISGWSFLRTSHCHQFGPWMLVGGEILLTTSSTYRTQPLEL